MPFSSTSRRSDSYSSIEKVLRFTMIPNLRWTHLFSKFGPTIWGKYIYMSYVQIGVALLRTYVKSSVVGT